MLNEIFQLNLKTLLLPDIRWYELFYFFWYEKSAREVGPSISDTFCVRTYVKSLCNFKTSVTFIVHTIDAHCKHCTKAQFLQF